MRKIKSSISYYLYGKHSVDSAMNNPARRVFELLVTKNNLKSINKYKAIIENKQINVKVLENSEINKHIGIEESVHQGIAIKVKKLELISMEQALKKAGSKSILLFLDQVTDPQNVGAIIRSSLAFDVDAVITTKDNAPSENASLVKATAGAFEFVPYIRITNLARTLDDIKKYGYWVVAITQDGDIPLNNLGHFDKIALILGGEGKGIRSINLKQSDMKVRINISDKLQSLNVSNAVAISLYNIRGSIRFFV